MTIEDLLIWAYRDEKVDRVEGRVSDEWMLAGPNISGCGVAAVARANLFGDIDCGRLLVAPSAPSDAAQLHGMVCALALETRILVMTHARAATRPDWRRRPPKARPVMRLTAHGEVPVIIYKQGNNHPDYCPVLWEGDDEGRAAQRREIYRLWAFGLTRLSNRLMLEPGLLERHCVSGHVPDLAPWRRERACTATDGGVRAERAERLTRGKTVDRVAAR